MSYARRQALSLLLAMSVGLEMPSGAFAQQQTPPEEATDDAQAQPAAAPLKSEQLQQLVAPIALYPDALLAQVLMASTYPLEVVQAARWSKENSKLKGDALEEAVQKQPWDPSVKSLAPLPNVLAMMNDKLDWTQKLGDAVLAQQEEVMAAVQTLRSKAKAEGTLKSSSEQKVSTQKSETGSAEVIIIEPAKPEVVYVPTYDPAVVYGAWPYPAYPPYYYYPPGYVAATSFITFGVGVAMGAALWGGVGWGYGYGGGNININNVNNYNRANRTNVSNRNWQHNPQHRKGVQYRDGATQQRYGRSGPAGAGSREAYRGRSAGDGRSADAPRSGQAPARQQPRSSAFDGAGGGRQASMERSRGQMSRQSAGRSACGRSGGMRGGGGGRRR